MDKTQQGHVKNKINNGIAEVEFYHPSHNSLPSRLLAALTEQITELGKNDDVILIYVRSGGDRTFCAGASFDELVNIEDEKRGKEFFLGFANVINAIRKCPKIVVGRVQGKAVGGGVGLASAFDYTIATQYASVKLSELAIGIGPFVIGPAVQRKMGVSAFSQLALDCTEWKDAEWAKSKGLFHEVFETAEQMDEYIDHFINNLKNMNPEALSLLKKVFWENCNDWDSLLEKRAEMSGRLVLSDFSKRTIAGFLDN